MKPIAKSYLSNPALPPKKLQWRVELMCNRRPVQWTLCNELEDRAGTRILAMVEKKMINNVVRYVYHVCVINKHKHQEDIYPKHPLYTLGGAKSAIRRIINKYWTNIISDEEIEAVDTQTVTSGVSLKSEYPVVAMSEKLLTRAFEIGSFPLPENIMIGKEANVLINIEEMRKTSGGINVKIKLPWHPVSELEDKCDDDSVFGNSALLCIKNQNTEGHRIVVGNIYITLDTEEVYFTYPLGGYSIRKESVTHYISKKEMDSIFQMPDNT